MSKEKKPNYAEALTFNDPELTTPLHDEIMCWTDSNAAKICKQLFKSKLLRSCWEFPVFRQMRPWDKYKIPAPREFQLFNSNSFSVDTSPEFYREVLHTTPPVTFCNEKVGHVDLLLSYETAKKNIGYIALEIKPVVFSLGELLRQVQHYRSHLPVDYAVVTPDTRFRSQIKSQGIYFVEYVPGRHRR